MTGEVVNMLKVAILLFSTTCLVTGVYQEAPCRRINGRCFYDYLCDNNNYEVGLCPTQPNNIKCCKGTYQEQQCLSQGGQCMLDSTCTGHTVSGKCPTQPFNVKCCISDTGDGDSGDCSYVSRTEWGAKSPKCSTSMTTPVYKLFIHHTAGATCSSKSTCSSVMRGIQNYHMNTRGWCDVGYSWLVGGDGRIYEGRGWDKVGAHTSGYNSVSLAISFMGNYQSANPPKVMIDAAKKWIQCAVQEGKLGSSYTLQGHRDVGSTSCPGQLLYNDIKTWERYP